MIVMNATDIKNNVIAVRSMSEIPSTLREELVVFGLARLVAFGTTIPAAPVDNPVAYFADNSKTAKGGIAEVHENTVVNMSKVLEMAGVIYRARYDMVHNSLSKNAQQFAMQSLVANGSYNFPQAIADALSQSVDSNDLGRSVGFALNMFSVAVLPDQATAVVNSDE